MKRALEKEQLAIKKVKAMTAKKELAQYYFRKYEIKATQLEIMKLTEK